MTKILEELAVNVNVSTEALAQKELAAYIEKVYQDHGCMITSINFGWDEAYDKESTKVSNVIMESKVIL